MALRALDLFCGAGGLSRGLVAAGFDVVAAVDSWPPALRSYAANFRSHMLLDKDVAEISSKDLRRIGVSDEIDVVAGGPPCQGFSHQRIGSDQDDRNDLVIAFAQVVLACRSRFFVMENVTGLLGARGKTTVRRFVALMSKEGYQVQHAVLDAADFGVAQNRQRVFFVGWRTDQLGGFLFPKPTVAVHKTVREAFLGLPSPPVDLTPSPGDPLHRRTKLSNLNQLRLSHVPPGGGFEDLPVELRVDCHKGGASRIGHRAVYGRLHPDRPAGTITGRFDSFTRGRFAHPIEDRNMSLREGARLQGFPDSHVFLGTQEDIAAQIGNAIPPPLAEAVMNAVGAALDRKSRTTFRLDSFAGLPLFAGVE
jgi:DNA (cytosine-5)-methyltransferase 1